MKEESLVDKAKKYKSSKRHGLTLNDENLKLAVAYFNGSVRLVQVCHALGINVKQSQNASSPIATVLRDGIINGKINLSIKS
jgi:hypothetical protein